MGYVRLQYFREVAFMIRRKMNNDDESGIAIGRDVRKKHLDERRESSRGCAYSNNAWLWFQWQLCVLGIHSHTALYDNPCPRILRPFQQFRIPRSASAAPAAVIG